MIGFCSFICVCLPTFVGLYWLSSLDVCFYRDCNTYTPCMCDISVPCLLHFPAHTPPSSYLPSSICSIWLTSMVTQSLAMCGHLSICRESRLHPSIIDIMFCTLIICLLIVFWSPLKVFFRIAHTTTCLMITTSRECWTMIWLSMWRSTRNIVRFSSRELLCPWLTTFPVTLTNYRYALLLVTTLSRTGFAIAYG
jgi:hypothetical protein